MELIGESGNGDGSISRIWVWTEHHRGKTRTVVEQDIEAVRARVSNGKIVTEFNGEVIYGPLPHLISVEYEMVEVVYV